MAKKQHKPTHKTQQATASRPATTPSLALPHFLTNKSGHCLFLLILSFLLYANTLNHDFTQDDAIVIYDNMYTAKGIQGIPDILAYDTFKGFFKEEGKEKLVEGGRYRPFTLVMFAIENQLFGTVKKDDLGNPVKDKNGDTLYEYPKAVGHFINILLYALTGILIYLLLLKLLRPTLKQEGAYMVALLSATIFVLHPIHTEAVANIKGRDEIMALLGSLGAVWFSWKAFEKKSLLWDIAAGVLFLIALFSKENAITFLVILPLVYRVFTNATITNIGMRLIPFLAAAGLFLMQRADAIGSGFPSQPNEMMNNPFLKLVGNAYVPFTIAEKMATNMYTLGKYIYLLIFPHPLTHDYYPRAVEVMGFGDWRVLLSMLVYAAILWLAVRSWKSYKVVSFGIIFYLVTLSIVSNIVFPVGTHMAERFVFMPSLGFCLVVAALAWKWTSGDVKKRLNPLLAGLGVVALLFAGKTIVRNTAWKDNYTLFTNDLQYSPNSAKLLNSVGGTLSEKAAKDTILDSRRQTLNQAVGHLQKALTIHPNYKNAHLLLGNCFLYLQEYDKAIASYQNALKLDNKYGEALKNMALAYQAGGKFFGETQGNVDKALQYLNEANRLEPNNFETLRLLGVANGVLAQMRRDPVANQRAIEFFILALTINPKDGNTLWDLGTAYFTQNEPVKAEEFFQKAEQAEPGIRVKRTRK